jgi:hypothetical protein
MHAGALAVEGTCWIADGCFARDSWIKDSSYVFNKSDVSDSVISGNSMVSKSIVKSSTIHNTPGINSKVSCSTIMDAYVRDSNIRRSNIQGTRVVDSSLMRCKSIGQCAIKNSIINNVEINTRADIDYASLIQQADIEYGSISFGEDFYADIVIYTLNQDSVNPYNSKYAVSISLFNFAKCHEIIVPSVPEANEYIDELCLPIDKTTMVMNLLQNLATRYFATNKEGVQNVSNDDISGQEV